MTSASSASNAAANKEKEGSSREKSRAEFVSSLIKAMEEAMEMSAAADADSLKNADASLAEKCVEKMRFDYPDATRKELERLSESIDLRVLMMTSRDGGGVAGGECGASLEFDSKVIENIALGATKADAAAERMQSATTTTTTRTRTTTTTERSENDNHATI